MHTKQLLAAFTLGVCCFAASAAIPSKFTITPGADAVVDNITTIEIFTPTESDVYSYSKPDITINGSAVAVTYATSGSDNDLLTYTLAEPITEPGKYNIVIGAESFFYGLYEYDNTEISWTVTVQSSTPPAPDVPEPIQNPANITINPEQGEVPMLDSFTITFGNVSIVDFNSTKTITLTKYPSGEAVTTAKIGDGAGMNDALITLAEKVTAPGNYLLTVPEGAAYDLMSDDDCPETRWVYTIKEGSEIPPETPDNFTSSPANGEIVESLSKIVVTFTDFDVVYIRDQQSHPTATLATTDGATVATPALAHALASNAVEVIFNEPITQKGKYIFTIPKNSIILGEDAFGGSGAKLNATVEVKFGIEPFAMPEVYEYADVTISPAQGRYTALSDFTLTFTQIQLPDINYTKKITLVNSATNEVVTTARAETGAVINQLVVILDEEVTAPGDYTLVCPEGAFYNGGSYDEEDLPEYKFRYLVDPAGEVIEERPDLVVADPASGTTVAQIDRIILTYPDWDAIYRHSNSGICVTNEQGAQVAAGDFSYGDTTGNQIVLKFSPTVSEAGKYTVVIPKRALILGDMKYAVFSSTAKLEYTVDPAASIASVGADAETSDAPIYNLQGIFAGNNPEALPAGLYIRAGRKIQVK